MTTAQLKETPLGSVHRKAGARMVDFAGWNMPVQYKSIIAEHMAVRTKVGIFDVSHMGEFIVKGAGAGQFIQHMIANDLKRLDKPNTALYTQMVMPNGGTVDDLIVYRRQDDFLLVVNASNIDKDWAWLTQHKAGFADVSLEDASEATALIALQGPNAQALWQELAGAAVSAMPSFTYGESTVCGIKTGFGRTGYTGEDGFEIFCASSDVERLWTVLVERGQQYGLELCGLGARDTLRLEAGLPLYGHELDENTSPLESGLGWSVKLEKGDFIGRQALLEQKNNGMQKSCVCLKVDGKALPRQGYPVLSNGQVAGQVTSGSQGVFVGYPIAMAFVPPAISAQKTTLSVEIRHAAVPAFVVKRPFYKRQQI